jgi:hypothetical protein
VPATSASQRRPPLAVIVAGVLALPAAYVALVLGNAALTIAGGRDQSGGSTWLILLITFGWVAGLLIGAGRLLTGRAWFGLVVSAGLLAALLTVGVVLGGVGGTGFGFSAFAWLVSVGTAGCASLPAVRRWVAARRRQRLFPGSVQPTSSR